MSVVIVMSRPTDWARAIGVVAKVTSMGAVATGFAIGMSTLHYAAPSLDAASISHDRFATDLCTDNPADPTCPPQGPTDVKCATAAWQATAFCVGGPFAPNIVTPPTLFPAARRRSPAAQAMCLLSRRPRTHHQVRRQRATSPRRTSLLRTSPLHPERLHRL